MSGGGPRRNNIGATARNAARGRVSAESRNIVEARRAEVYRDDVPHAPEASRQKVPKLGTPERQEFDEKILNLRATGMSILNISLAMDTNMEMVRVTLNKYKKKEASGGAAEADES